MQGYFILWSIGFLSVNSMQGSYQFKSLVLICSTSSSSSLSSSKDYVLLTVVDVTVPVDIEVSLIKNVEHYRPQYG